MDNPISSDKALHNFKKETTPVTLGLPIEVVGQLGQISHGIPEEILHPTTHLDRSLLQGEQAANQLPDELRPEDLARVNAELDGAGPHEIMKYAQTVFGEGLTMACSFQDLVMLDIAVKTIPDIQIFTIDTGFLFFETEETIRRAQAHYPEMRLNILQPKIHITAQAQQHRHQLYHEDSDACCAIRKLEPMRRALEGRKAWMTGIRRDQSATRATIQAVAWDYKWNIVKFAPLCNWTADDVWSYAEIHKVPYNRLIDRGYPSIGCAPCTRAPVDGDPRSGRWADSKKTECGLHGETPANPILHS